jgi:hypothetical protein
MISVQPESKVIRSNVSKESKFSLKASPEMFDLLSSKLYAYKFDAIVRELATNASDAQVAAGKGDIPIKVFGPTAFNPVFSVEDCGDGIPFDQFEKIYTVYGESTKTYTNDQVGCFGIGSKSPFAYTSQFTVENCHGGKKYTYSCFKDSDRQPSVALLSEVPTDKSGVKVFFAVKSMDFSNFTNAMSNVLKWFDVTPETNIPIAKLARDEEVFSLPTFDSRSHFFIRMGQVVYPVSDQYVQNVFRTGYRNSSIVINVPIGSVCVTPSRESVEYTEHTKKYLQTRSTVLLDHCLNLLKSVEDDHTLTKFEKFKTKKRLANDLQLQPGVFSKLNVDQHFCTIDPMKIPFDVYAKQYYRKTPYKVTYRNSNVEFQDENIIFFFDKKKGNMKRLATFFNTVSGRSAGVFVFDPAAKPELLKMGFEEKDFHYASKIDVVSQTREKTNCCELTFSQYYGTFTKTGVYLDPSVNDGVYVKEDQFKDLSILGYKKFQAHVKEKVYVFTDRQYELLKIEKKNFVHLFDFFKKNLQDFPVETLRAFHVFDHNGVTHNALLKLSKLTNSGVINEYVKNFPTSVVKENDLATIFFLIRGMEALNLEETKKTYENLVGVTDLYTRCTDDINKKYPLLKYLIDKQDFDGIIDDVVGYINLIGE